MEKLYECYKYKEMMWAKLVLNYIGWLRLLNVFEITN